MSQAVVLARTFNECREGHIPVACSGDVDGLSIMNGRDVDTMKFIISGKNIDVTPGLKAAIEDKIGKLEKYFTPETEVQATLSVEKERQKIEVTIPMKGNIIRS